MTNYNRLVEKSRQYAKNLRYCFYIEDMRGHRYWMNQYNNMLVKMLNSN